MFSAFALLKSFSDVNNILVCYTQQIAALIAVYANFRFARIKAMRWGWALVVWVYSLVTYISLDVLKFIIRYVLSGRVWNNLLDNKVNIAVRVRKTI